MCLTRVLKALSSVHPMSKITVFSSFLNPLHIDIMSLAQYILVVEKESGEFYLLDITILFDILLYIFIILNDSLKCSVPAISK